MILRILVAELHGKRLRRVTSEECFRLQMLHSSQIACNVPPRVAENPPCREIRWVLTSSDHNIAHTSNPTNFRHRYCAMATLDHLKPLRLENYIRIVSSSPHSLRAFFHGKTVSIRYSTTLRSLLFATHMKASCSSLRVLLSRNKRSRLRTFQPVSSHICQPL